MLRIMRCWNFTDSVHIYTQYLWYVNVRTFLPRQPAPVYRRLEDAEKRMNRVTSKTAVNRSIHASQRPYSFKSVSQIFSYTVSLHTRFSVVVQITATEIFILTNVLYSLYNYNKNIRHGVLRTLKSMPEKSCFADI